MQRFLDRRLADASSEVVGLATEKNHVYRLYGAGIFTMKDCDWRCVLKVGQFLLQPLRRVLRSDTSIETCWLAYIYIILERGMCVFVVGQTARWLSRGFLWERGEQAEKDG